MTKHLHIRELTEDDKLIVASNDYIYGILDFSINHLRVITSLQSCIHLKDEEFRYEEIDVSAMIRKAGLSSGKHIIYEEIEKMADELMDKKITLRNGRSFKKIHLLDSFEYDDQRGVIIARFHDEMKPYFLGLKSNFTSSEENNFWQFDSSRSYRYFSILKSHVWAKDKRPLRVSLEYMRKLLGLQDKYKNFNDFRKRVLTVAQRHIEKDTDIFFEYVEESNGKTRAITDIVFIIYEQHPIWKFFDKVISLDAVVKIDEPSQLKTELGKFGLVGDDITKLIKKYDFDYLVEKIRYVTYRVTGHTLLKNCGGYLQRTLLNDYKFKNVEFAIASSDAPVIEEVSDAPAIEEVSNASTETTIDVKSRLTELGLGKIVASRFIKKYGEAYILEKIAYVEAEMKKRDIGNLGGYIRSAIEDDYKDNTSSMDAANRSARKKSAQKASESAKNKEEEETKQEQKVVEYSGYYGEIERLITENVSEDDRKKYLKKLIEENGFLFQGLVKAGKTSFKEVLDYPYTRSHVLDSMVKNFFKDDIHLHSLEAWKEHIGASKDSSTLSDKKGS